MRHSVSISHTGSPKASNADCQADSTGKVFETGCGVELSAESNGLPRSVWERFVPVSLLLLFCIRFGPSTCPRLLKPTLTHLRGIDKQFEPCRAKKTFPDAERAEDGVEQIFRRRLASQGRKSDR